MTSAALLAATALPASATTDGEWWVEAMKIDEVHEEVTGEGVTIALLDGPVYLDAPELQGQDVIPSGTRCPHPYAEEEGYSPLVGPPSDETSHATGMAALLVGNGNGVRGIAPDATLRTYVVLEHRSSDATGQAELGCRYDSKDDREFFREVLADEPDIVLIPLAWVAHVEDVMNEAIRDGVVFVVAAGNDGHGAHSYGFSRMDGVVNVVAGTPDGALADFNTIDPDLKTLFLTEDGEVTEEYEDGAVLAPHQGGAGRPTILAPGVDIRTAGYLDGRWQPIIAQGTSAASGLAAGALALAMEKWPEASGNQVLQSMVRNANRTYEYGHDSYYGFGGLSLSSLLREDPTQYPDVHPYYGGLRWAFEDDPPEPYMPGVDETGIVELWRPTYAEDELDLPEPWGPPPSLDEPTATPTAPTTESTIEESPAAVADDAGAAGSGAAPPWGWFAGGGSLLVAAVAAVALLRRRAVPTDALPSPAMEGPRT